MGYAFVVSNCFGCHRPFGYNPVRVPVIVVDGERLPICQTCVDSVNPRRIVKGLPPIFVLPGAYEPVDENELH